MTDNIRTLFVDLETKPTSAYVWGLWDQNVGLNQIVEPGNIICWSSKWKDADETEFSSIQMTKRKYMLEEIWNRLDEADEVVGWNSNSFDLKLLNAEFAIHGMGPPSPYKKIDLMRIVKANMKFISNKLDFIAGAFGVGHKLEHAGFDLWIACMQGDEEAWRIMQEYNEQDVLLTERMYYKLLPWITTGVNRSAVVNGFVCPTCGSDRLHSKGTARTTTMTYRRYHCQNCGAWPRERIAIKEDRSRQLVLTR